MGARHLSLDKTHEVKRRETISHVHHLPPFKEKKRDFYFISHAHMLPFAPPFGTLQLPPICHRFILCPSLLRA